MGATGEEMPSLAIAMGWLTSMSLGCSFHWEGFLLPCYGYGLPHGREPSRGHGKGKEFFPKDSHGVESRHEPSRESHLGDLPPFSSNFKCFECDDPSHQGPDRPPRNLAYTLHTHV